MEGEGLASKLNSYGDGKQNTIGHFYAGGPRKGETKKKDVKIDKKKKKG